MQGQLQPVQPLIVAGTLTSDIRFRSVTSLADGATMANIGVGTKVDSHLIFIDPAAIPDPAGAGGTVTSSGRILGHRWSQTGPMNSRGPPGAKGIIHGRLRPLETAGDVFGFAGRTLTRSFVSSASTGDCVRIICRSRDGGHR